MPHGFYLALRLQGVTTFRDCIKFQSLLRNAVNPTGAQKGDPTAAQRGGDANLYTVSDLAAAMELNRYIVASFVANGYYDA